MRSSILRLATVHGWKRSNSMAISVTCSVSACRAPSAVMESSLTSLCSSKQPVMTSSFVLNRPFDRFLHTSQEDFCVRSIAELQHEEEETDESMNEFLSRFVYIIRQKLKEAYPHCDKETVDAMLLVICQKVVSEMEKGNLNEMRDSSSKLQSLDLSVDLWRTIWEVSQGVLEDMRKELKNKQLKKFLHAEDVRAMCRFAGDIGIRGDLLRELRFKWAREKLEESEFYRGLELLAQEAGQEERTLEGKDATQMDDIDFRGKHKVVTLPRRHGKIKYQIYGLDLSSSVWEEVADRIHEAEKKIFPEEPKEITGKCRMITQRLFTMKEDDDPSQLLAEWIELLSPRRVDWIALLGKLENCNMGLYFKVAELILDEKTFEAGIQDYSKLIDAYAKETRVRDAEKILEKMTQRGLYPDVVTWTFLVDMYTKANDLQRAKHAFENLRNQGIRPDVGLYSSMIKTFVKGGEPKSGEILMREMESRGLKPTREIYMELLQAFAQQGHADGAQKMFNAIHYAGLQPDLEVYTLLLEAYGHAGDPDLARSSFDEMRKQAGYEPDDRSTASMMAAYEKKNLLDKALCLLLELQKDGFKPGIATQSVMVDWLGKLQLVDEAEQLLKKIVGDGHSPPFKLYIGLCDMYARSGLEAKTLDALSKVESKKEELTADEFERIIYGLLAGGLVQHADRVHELMKKQGIASSEPLKVALMAAQAIPRTVHRQRQKIR